MDGEEGREGQVFWILFHLNICRCRFAVQLQFSHFARKVGMCVCLINKDALNSVI